MPTSQDPAPKTGQSLLVYCLLLGAVLYSLGWQTPSKTAYQQDKPATFSQTRAFEHLRHIARVPHYTGSHGHNEVKNYLFEQLKAMGLEPSIQRKLVTSAKYNASAEVENIVARLPANRPSTSAKKALLLLTHYDSSNYSSLGASDAGSGVVTILEGLRAYMNKDAPQNNDIIVVFSDAEEQGLLGAEAFVNYHPWANDIGLVLNFEARGSGGPSYMLLETNSGNSKLIAAFAAAGIQYPVANSMLYSLYKHLPNDTDLTVFREKGNINGFNFAFIDDHFDYHTEQDSVERLDPDTLNHQADYLMALLPYFANQDLSSLDSNQDSVFFNVVNMGMVHYPYEWSWPLFAVCVLLLVIVIYTLNKQQYCSFKSLMVTSIPAVLSLVLALLIGVYGWKLLIQLWPHYLDIPHGFTYNGHSINTAFLLFCLALSTAIFHWFTYRFSEVNAPSIGIVGVLLWLVISGLVCLYLPGASFFIIPPISLVFALFVYANKRRYFTLCSILLLLPSVLIFTPFLPTFTVGLGLFNLAFATGSSIALWLLILPALATLKGFRYLSVALCIAAVGFMTHANLNADFNLDRKKPNSVNYLLDADNQRAFWFSYNRQLDAFTEQFFVNDDLNQGQLNELYIDGRRKPGYVKKAEWLPLSVAQIKVTTNKKEGEQRKIELRITPARQNNMIQLVSYAPLNIEKLSINGEVYNRKTRHLERGVVLRHVVTRDQPINITLHANFEQPPNLRVIETRFDLFEAHPDIQPRSEMYMPEPFEFTDATILSQKIKLD